MPSKLNRDGKMYLYGPVGGSFWTDEGFTAGDVLDALAEHEGDEIDVHVNSPGGLAFDGIAIYNAFKASDKLVRMHIDALAASAASVIAMAGDEIIMRDGALFMIHDASGITMGNAATHEKQIEILNKLDGQIAGVYSKKSGKSPKWARDAMDAETWMDADEAIKNGFATSKSDDEPTAFSSYAYQDYKHAPAQLPRAPDGEKFKPSQASLAAYTAALKAAVPEPVATPKEQAAMDISKLRSDFPALYDEVLALGVKAERDRVSSIMALSAPGADKVVAACIADGSDAGKAAVALLAHERGSKAAALTAAAADEAAVTGLASKPAPAVVDPKAKPSASMPLGDDRFKAEWSEMSAEERQPYISGIGGYIALRRRQAKAA